MRVRSATPRRQPPRGTRLPCPRGVRHTGRVVQACAHRSRPGKQTVDELFDSSPRTGARVSVRAPRPFDTSPGKLAFGFLRAELSGGQRFGLASVHLTPIIPSVEMRHAGHAVPTPETFRVPRDGQDVIAAGCHEPPPIVVSYGSSGQKGRRADHRPLIVPTRVPSQTRDRPVSRLRGVVRTAKVDSGFGGRPGRPAVARRLSRCGPWAGSLEIRPDPRPPSTTPIQGTPVHDAHPWIRDDGGYVYPREFGRRMGTIPDRAWSTLGSSGEAR